MADLKTQAVGAEAPALAHRVEALIAAIAAAEAACLPGALVSGTEDSTGSWIRPTSRIVH
ncbi:hypothetical protein [Roseospira goensis]|uniref:Uncharacterized protein n=1 Tax=Roseospira goensis TaxID=391922 RepID=A0A7W6WKR2_9PROT|nr:hypothetical protein [Roseospira goensis]MBB4285913.1 hypothetical protein [Roseospira goensis]